MDIIARSPKQIADAIRRIRQSRNLSQVDVARLANLRQPTVSKFESGSPETQLKTLSEILTALDLELVVRPRSKAPLTLLEDLF